MLVIQSNPNYFQYFVKSSNEDHDVFESPKSVKDWEINKWRLRNSFFKERVQVLQLMNGFLVYLKCKVAFIMRVSKDTDW